MKVLRTKDVVKVIGMSRSSLAREISEGRFVTPIALGPRSRGYLESDVLAWLESRRLTAGPVSEKEFAAHIAQQAAA